MYRLHEPSEFDEAQESLRVIREVMERSTKHSSLSGLAGILIGIWAILGVVATTHILHPDPVADMEAGASSYQFTVVWGTVFVLSALTDFLLNKLRAAKFGKRIVSALGGRILQASAPAFLAGAVISGCILYMSTPSAGLDLGIMSCVFSMWMILYGLAGCAVGLFSAKPVSMLGWAFLLLGLFGLCTFMWENGLWLMAISFAGFHIIYGLYTGITRGDW